MDIHISRCESFIREVIVMTNYREILRLTVMGLSQRDILRSVKCSQKTVVKVQQRAKLGRRSSIHC